MKGESPASTSSTPASSTSFSIDSHASLPMPSTQPIPKKSQQIKTDKPRPHVCTICTRGFARLEHLKRHERSHTNEKPFQCAACGRCFARRDLVLRHQQKLHTSLPNIMRRGSSKDSDNTASLNNASTTATSTTTTSGATSNGNNANTSNNNVNEHIIVLPNNTSANAPLPSSATLLSQYSNLHSHSHDPEHSRNNSNSMDIDLDDKDQLFSPPPVLNTSITSNNHNSSTSKPQFRTTLFNTSNGNNGGQSIHNISNHDTPNTHLSSLSPPNNSSNMMISSPIPSSHNNSPAPSITLPSSRPLHHSQSRNSRNNSQVQQPSPQSHSSPHRVSISGSGIPPPKPIPHHLQQQQSQQQQPQQASFSPTQLASSKSTPIAMHDQAPHSLPQPITNQPLRQNPQISNLASNQYRHVSFSAASNISYTNLKDALNIQQQNNNISESAPSQVEFATPQLTSTDDLTSKNLMLSGLDLSSYSMLDWNNIENLDLSGGGNDATNGDQPNLTAKQKSIRNLQQFFLENVNGNNKNISELPNFIASHNQFSNPNHPHHLKGTTPFELGLNAPNDMNNIMNNLVEKQQQSQTLFHLNGKSLDDKKSNIKNKKNSVTGNQPKLKKVKREESNSTDKSSSESINTPATNFTNNGMPITISSNDDDWLKDIISTPYDANMQSILFNSNSTNNLQTILGNGGGVGLPNAGSPNGFTVSNTGYGLFDPAPPSLLSSPKLLANNIPQQMQQQSQQVQQQQQQQQPQPNILSQIPMAAGSIELQLLGNSPELSSLFRSRQNEMVHQLRPSQMFSLPSQVIPEEKSLEEEESQRKPASKASQQQPPQPQSTDPSQLSSSNEFTRFELTFDSNVGKDYNFITETLRTRIISISKIQNNQFPTLEELNEYMRLYELEFNKYFPFIHLPSLKNPLVDNFENIPLLLSMASIGALYSFHDNNTLILFNLSKFHIQSFFEKEITLDNLQFKKVPLMAHQCLVLHIFISMFLNEPNMIDITSRQIKSMIGLIKSTNFNEPLQQFLIPPNSILEIISQEDCNSINLSTKNQQLLQNNFDYFIMAQSRIRTIHVFYLLQTFRSSLIGLPIYFNSKFLKNGNHCYLEELWRCETSQSWLKELSKSSFIPSGNATAIANATDNKKSTSSQSLVDLSNGESLENLLKLLQDNSINNKASKLSYLNCLTLLIYIHEQVQFEILNIGKSFTYVDWKLNHKLKLQKLLSNWESKYLQNDGILTVNSYNRNQLNIKNELKLILPLYSFLKIKLEINLNPIMNAVLNKDFLTMNNQLNLLILQEEIHENIKNSLPYCFNIIQIWVQNIETINYDIKQTSLRTPVFFVACLFVAILIISNYLNYLESKKILKNQILTDNDLINWLNCESKMLIVENVLSPVLKSSYSEMLTKQQDGIFSSIKDNKHVKKINQLIEQKQRISNDLLIINENCIITQPENQAKLSKLNKELTEEIKEFNLSRKVLYLGIRILADAPVWPVAMGFAEALKNRASYLALRKNSPPGSGSVSVAASGTPVVANSKISAGSTTASSGVTTSAPNSNANSKKTKK